VLRRTQTLEDRFAPGVVLRPEAFQGQVVAGVAERVGEASASVTANAVFTCNDLRLIVSTELITVARTKRLGSGRAGVPLRGF
jgi:hypothetical protein